MEQQQKKQYEDVFKYQYETFLRTLYNNDDYVAIAMIDHEKGKAEHIFCYIRELFEEEMIKKLRYENKTNKKSIYITVNTMIEGAKQRTAENFTGKVNKIWLDVDAKHIPGQVILAKMRKIFGEPTLVVRTSKNQKKWMNYQVYFKLDREYDYKEVQDILMKINDLFNIDHTHDIARVFRIAGFKNQKKHVQQFASIVHIAQDNIYTLEHFQKILERLKEIDEARKERTTKQEIQQEIQELKKSIEQESLDLDKIKEFAKTEIEIKTKNNRNNKITKTIEVLYDTVPGRSRSEKDMFFTIYVITHLDKEKLNKDILQQFLILKRMDQKRDVYDYAVRTIRKAEKYIATKKAEAMAKQERKTEEEKDQIDKTIDAIFSKKKATTVLI